MKRHAPLILYALLWAVSMYSTTARAWDHNLVWMLVDVGCVAIWTFCIADTVRDRFRKQVEVRVKEVLAGSSEATEAFVRRAANTSLTEKQ